MEKGLIRHNGSTAYDSLRNDVKNYIQFLKGSGATSLPCRKRESEIPPDAGLPVRPLKLEPQQAHMEPELQQTPAKPESLHALKSELDGCSRCRLHEHRNNMVFGVGNPYADLLFVGEAPGFEEDKRGEPFVGKAGRLLTKMIESIGLKREDVYICNVVKCRPPENRNPLPDEIAACSPYLLKQIETVRPKAVCALGKFAAQTLLKNDAPISALRGKAHPFQKALLIPTYHPAFLLRNPSAKRQAWDDFKEINALLHR